jgi:hypothetical protein
MKNKSKFNLNVGIVAIYTVIPTWHGAADISRLMLKYFPSKKKCLFQMTNLKKKINNKNVINQNIFFNSPYTKLFFIFFLTKKIIKYFSGNKKNIIIIEGASWTLFSYIIAKILKNYVKNLKIIYHSHNVDYEVRKLKNSKFILWLTKLFEKKLLELSDIKTAVSKTDQKLFKKLYNIETVLLENGVEKFNEKKVVSNLKLPKKFIFFPGSYTYGPNKIAIDKIMNNFYDEIITKFPNYYFVFSGEGLPNKYSRKKNVKYFGILSETNYFFTLTKSAFIFLPLNNAPGTKLKTLQSLSLNKIILATKHAFKGINIKKNDRVLIYKKNKDVINNIDKIINKKIKTFKIKRPIKKNRYYFNNIINEFFINHL